MYQQMFFGFKNIENKDGERETVLDLFNKFEVSLKHIRMF